MSSRDKSLFFLGWLRSPKYVGAIAPSSRALANAIAEQLSQVGASEYVVELGPGTGAVTRAIFNSGLKQHQLVMVERDPAFLHILKQRFPNALILEGDANNLKELLGKHGIKQVAAIVSGLPLMSMSEQVRNNIVKVAFDVIKPHGQFIQYTYRFISPIAEKLQRAMGIQGRVAKRVWSNLPPARVWRYEAPKTI